VERKVRSSRVIEVGTLFRGRYEVEAVLGRGGFGATYQVIDRDALDRRKVLKELLPDREGDAKAQDLFEREARILDRLDHPGIPRLDAFFVDDGRYYLVESFVQGQTLEAVLAKRSRLPEGEAIHIAEAVLKILKYLHELTPPVIHRDIKPSNLMVTEAGGYVLIDFGAVREVLSVGTETVPDTTMIGSNGFTPPEQRVGQAYPASDLYALGATLVKLVTAKHPWHWYNAREGPVGL